MAAEHAEALAARIAERRKELRLSQGEVAARFASLSVNKDYISRWERSQNLPSPEHLEGLARALETTVADLVGGPLRPEQNGQTPDLMATVSPNGSQLARVEELLTEALQLLRGLHEEDAASTAEGEGPPPETLPGESDEAEPGSARADQ